MSLGKRKSNAPVGFSFNPNVETQLNTSLLGMGNKQLTDAERIKLGMPPLSNPSLVKFELGLPKKEDAKAPIVTPPVTATNIPKQSWFGNKIASMGGFNDKLKTDAELKLMTQDQVDAYEKDRLQARNVGKSDLLMALGTAFKGGDIAESVQGLRDQRTVEQEAMDEDTLNQEIAQAYADGNYNLVNQLMLKSGNKSGTQSIMNNVNRDTPMISTDGKLIYERDKFGNIIGASPNQEVIDALNPKKKLSYSAIREIKADEKKNSTMSNQVAEIENFEKQISDGELGFGLFEGVGDRIGQNFGREDQESRNSLAFDNWRTDLVNKALAMQTGTKTDFDWEQVSKALQSANSKEGVQQFLAKYKQGLLKEVEANNKGIDLIYDASDVVRDNDIEFRTRD